MTRTISPLAIAILLASSCITKAARVITSAAQANHVLPPSRDPFYQVPPHYDIDQLQPGSILRHRQPPSKLAFFGQTIEDFVKEKHQILYRTTDRGGNATATVLTILLPPSADYGKILSLQVAEDAASIDCAPSFGFQSGSYQYPKLASPIVQSQLLLAVAALHEGWVVIIPDHEGPQGVYPANRGSARAVLDGVRAAHQSSSFTSIEEMTTVALWGYSDGGLATLKALEEQPSYASELKIAGAAIGATKVPTNDFFKQAAKSINKSPGAGFLPTMVVSAVAGRLALEKMVTESLKPEFRDEFYSPRSQCLAATREAFANKDILSMFDSLDALNSLGDVVSDLPINPTTPRAPIFWYGLNQDELIDPKETYEKVQKYCADGATIDFELDNGDFDHTRYAIVGAQSALKWLRDILSGSKQISGCTKRETLTRLADVDFIGIFPKSIQAVLLEVLSQPTRR
ncbi:hypothetical protein HIM_01889 [Hirsutella minnesotensis 3608]|nr:hypothetical protein HIM_01889 [Hirsutella minnesotensis 3608]